MADMLKTPLFQEEANYFQNLTKPGCQGIFIRRPATDLAGFPYYETL